MWRSGRALYKISINTSSNRKGDLVKEGFDLLSQALEKDDKNCAIHTWYAILLDARSHLDGIRERLSQLKNVKKHMQVG